jgi:hypothetical protein
MFEWLLPLLLLIFIIIIFLLNLIFSNKECNGLESVTIELNSGAAIEKPLNGNESSNGGVDIYAITENDRIPLPYTPLPNGEGIQLITNSKTAPNLFINTHLQNSLEIPKFIPTDLKNPIFRFDVTESAYTFFKVVSLPDGSYDYIYRFKWPVKTYSIRSLPLEEQIMLNASAIDVPLTNFQVPMTFDARQQWPGAITGALNQLDCGSCWAFATTTCLSDRYRKVYPNEQKLRRNVTYMISSAAKYTSMNNVSPYQLARCDICPSDQPNDPNKICQYGCQGGFIAPALQYLTDIGGNTIAEEKSEIITDQSAPCGLGQIIYKGIAVGKVSEMITKNASPDEIQTAILKVKQEIYQNGPVCAAFTVYNDFYDYKSGVYSGGSRGIAGGHAVVIVGWGSDYWIVRNSWSETWGMNGFFNIKIDWTPPNLLDAVGNPNLGILDEIWTLAVG